MTRGCALEMQSCIRNALLTTHTTSIAPRSIESTCSLSLQSFDSIESFPKFVGRWHQHNHDNVKLLCGCCFVTANTHKRRRSSPPLYFGVLSSQKRFSFVELSNFLFVAKTVYPFAFCVAFVVDNSKDTIHQFV
jgi:hypothetical protein